MSYVVIKNQFEWDRTGKSIKAMKIIIHIYILYKQAFIRHKNPIDYTNITGLHIVFDNISWRQQISMILAASLGLRSCLCGISSNLNLRLKLNFFGFLVLNNQVPTIVQKAVTAAIAVKERWCGYRNA